MKEKKWQISPKIDQELLEKFPEINSLILQLLNNRNIKTQKDIDAFLNPNYDEQVADPYLFKDMTKAVERLMMAIHNHEKVMIYGDYDADGVCSTVILYQTLKALGLDLDIYIPFRESEGYGLNTKIVQQIINQGFKLIITVDCGVSNKKEIDIFNESEVDVIILDHHDEPLELPSALAIINPSLKNSGYPPNRLCGAGVVFKFVQAIIIHQEKEDSPIKLPFGFEKWLLDLVAIATIGDIVPLINENRILVKYGLTVLAKTKNLGLIKLMEVVNNQYGQLDSEYVGWRLVPRLNAAGRVNHANVSFNLLVSSTEEEAEKWAKTLDDNNKQRQQLTEKMLSDALSQIGEPTDEQKILIAIGDSWPAGVVGLVAGKMCDRFARPALIFGRSTTDEGEIKYTGSGRSIAGFDVTQALKDCHEYILRFGGHPQACGLTIMGDENFEKFKTKISALASERLINIDLSKVLAIDAEIKLKDISWEAINELQKFEPYGEGNREPLFSAYNLNIEQIQTVGNDGKHLKVLVSQDSVPEFHKLIGFSFGEWCAKLNIGDKIDIVFELGINEWNGNREIQLKIEDLKISEK
ncbi:MAG: single-stranded-DNA-specific exonuclease RecJ [bacterium]